MRLPCLLPVCVGLGITGTWFGARYQTGITRLECGTEVVLFAPVAVVFNCLEMMTLNRC